VHSNNRKNFFSVLEITVVVALFTVIIISAIGIFTVTHNSWRIQKAEFELIQNARWALHFMVQELRQSHISSLQKVEAGSFSMCDGAIASACNGLFAYSPDSSRRLFYVREGTVLYRGEGDTWTEAIQNRQKVSGYLYYDSQHLDDPENGVFAKSPDNLYTIFIRLRDVSTVKNGKPVEYLLQEQFSPRNGL